MQNYFINIFSNQSFYNVIIAILSSVVLGSVICISYANSHSRAIYSKSFNMSLMMFTILSALSINIIAENLTLAIGALSALSIIRYRNAIKDHRDIIFIFWSIGAGLCCGLSEYAIAGVGSAAIFAFMVFLKVIYNNENLLVVVRGKADLEEDIIEIFNKDVRGKAKLKVNNSTSFTTELIFELPESLKNKKSICEGLKRHLYEINNIEAVNFVNQIEEVGV